jgi:Ca2+-binding RTX toxin-like protein
VIFRFGGLVSANLEIDVSLGDGNNSFLLDSHGWNATPDPQIPLLQPSLHVAGGAERDAIIARLGQVSGNLQVALDGREGNDVVAADLLFAQLGLGMIDIALAGGAGNDLLSLLAPGQSNQERTRLVIDGGAGFDIGIGTPNVDAFNCEVVIGARRRR